jgi:3-deoxy-manno-octulosonate cytidylyltransferase (CMP-KDO synthetase)
VNHTGSNPPNKPKIRTVAIIPARYQSVRLPGKALRELAGKPMICWVVERALAARNIDRTIVATDDERIVDVVADAGYEVVMTRSDHRSGTDRIAEVAAWTDEAEIIVNVQGDEPLLSPRSIELAVDTLIANPQTGIVTTWEPMDSIDDVLNPDVVKIVVEDCGRALYFSRSPVPFPRDAVRFHGSLETALRKDSALLANFRKHTGLYVYRSQVLLNFTKWPQSKLEKIESLEQLRALEHGVEIRAVEATTRSIGVDNEADLERVRSILEHENVELASSGSE